MFPFPVHLLTGSWRAGCLTHPSRGRQGQFWIMGLVSVWSLLSLEVLFGLSVWVPSLSTHLCGENGFQDSRLL